MDPSLEHGQHPRQRGHPGRHEGHFPSCPVVLHPAAQRVVAVFRSFKSCIQAQASATLASSVLDGSFDDVGVNKACWRQSSAERAAGGATDLCDKNQAWTSWRQFREAVEKANELHATGDLFR